MPRGKDPISLAGAPMKRNLIAALMMIGSYLALRWCYDAPQWGAIIGSWVFWALVRPKEWA